MSINKYNPTTGELELLAGGTTTLYADAPIGSIIPFGGTTAPDGFLLCQGQAVSRTTYAELFAVIGTSFGSGDGSTTFNVPDLRETVPVGSGTRGSGVTVHDTYTVGRFKDDQLQDHRHYRFSDDANGSAYASTAGTGVWTPSSESGDYGSEVGHISTGRTGTTTHGKQLGVNYIIKATQVDVPADFAPVDVVENGNLKAVTSNAVYDALAVIDSPITKVGTAINGDRFWSKRTGNVVEIMIDGTTGSNIPCAQSVVVAKVPKNALTISDVCIEIDSKSLVSAPESGHKRAWVDSTGNVCVFIVMPDLAATYTGNIYIGGTYITAE